MGKKILDYLFVPKFVNQYITECLVKLKLDFESDHKILITEFETPKDKSARWKPRSPKAKKLDISKLNDFRYQSEYKIKATDEINKRKSTIRNVDEISNDLAHSLTTAASEVLLNKSKKKTN